MVNSSIISTTNTLLGASLENIKLKQLYKDNKIGGYIFKITYKNDLEYSYEYHYYLRERGSKEIISDIMYCSVYDSSNSSIDSPYKNVKYPPIE